MADNRLAKKRERLERFFLHELFEKYLALTPTLIAVFQFLRQFRFQAKEALF
jgi:hypothetical protein